MRQLRDSLLFNPVIWLSFGSILLLLGIAGLYDLPAISAQLRQLQQLPDLTDSPPGVVAMFEGRISPQTPLVYDEFVSYVQEQYQSCGETSCWVETGRESPPLWVAIADETVRIANQSYRFESTEHTLEEAAPTWTKGSRRSRGFRRGSPVFGIGEVVALAGERQVAAEFIWAGTRADYLAHLRAYHRRSVWWGGGFLASGLALSAIGGWQGWRFVQSVRSSPQPGASGQLAKLTPHTVPRKKKQR